MLIRDSPVDADLINVFRWLAMLRRAGFVVGLMLLGMQSISTFSLGCFPPTEF